MAWRGRRAAEAALRLLALFLVGVMAYRMTLGVDLSDEAYYITFNDEWLKAGLRGGNSLVLHQTAALLVHPFAALYAAVAGLDGLNLFLRGLYLLMAVTAATSVYGFVRSFRDRDVARAVALPVLCFIPFSLPAPSYNTIAMFAATSALALFGTWRIGALISARPWRLSPLPAVLSALAWMVAVLAYPTLVVALAALVGMLVLDALYRRDAAPALLYAGLCAAFQMLGTGLLVTALGPETLVEILEFSNAAMQVSDGTLAKFGQSFARIGSFELFALLCLAALLPGLLLVAFRGPVRHAAACVALLAILGASAFAGPVLFVRAHDVVLLLALAGLPLMLSSPMPEAPPAVRRVIRIVWATSFLAGLAAAATATHGMFNFAIGALLAAALLPALLVPHGAAVAARLASQAVPLFVTAIFCITAFLHLYGERGRPFDGPVRRVDSGVFRGLLTTRARADFIEGSTRLLAETLGPDADRKSVFVVGRLPGIYLLTPARPATLSTWDFTQFYGSLPALEDRMDRFLAQNRPDAVLVVTDPPTRPPGPRIEALLAGYRIAGSFSSDWTTLTVHLRRD